MRVGCGRSVGAGGAVARGRAAVLVEMEHWSSAEVYNEGRLCPPWCWQVCNNKGNCHCDPGWNPPHCKTRGSSVGGSVDSALGAGECHGRAPRAPWFYQAQQWLPWPRERPRRAHS